MPDSGSEDPPDMPPIRQDPGSLVYQSVNVGGDTAINDVTVTGCDVSDIIVTARRVTAIPGNVTSPDLPVYQYGELMAGHYECISSAVIEFDVPLTFQKNNHGTPDQVGLCMLRNRTWICLPTQFVGNINGRSHYRAEIPEFSFFAIVMNNSNNPGIPVGGEGTMQPSISEFTPTKNDIQVVSRSTLQAATTTDPDEKNPVVPVATGILGLCVLATAAVLIFRTGNWR